jgi:hypothetical protein
MSAFGNSGNFPGTFRELWDIDSQTYMCDIEATTGQETGDISLISLFSQEIL